MRSASEDGARAGRALCLYSATMWLLTSAGAAWALPFGLGVSGLYDFKGPGGPGSNVELGCGKAVDGSQLDGGCGSLERDASLPITLGVVAPLWIEATPNASLRIEPRASYSLGKTRAVCGGESGGCEYNVDAAGAPLLQSAGTYVAVNTHVPSLVLSAGPDVRLTTGGGVAPHVAGLVGAGLIGAWMDSDYFKEKRSLLPTLSASAAVGVTSAPGGTGWFVDLSYAVTKVPGASVQDTEGAKPIEVDAFLVNGVRLDAGVRFGG